MFGCIFCLGQNNLNIFRIMTFNVCHAGATVENGLAKIAKHILAVNPDIVPLQEIDDKNTVQLLQLLGRKWKRCNSRRLFLGKYLDTVIITKHAILEDYEPVDGFFNCGCRILINRNSFTNISVIVWNVHLFYLQYGPYKICHEQNIPDKIIFRSEYKYRVSKMHTLLSIMENSLKNADKVPVIVAGDFNSPSHLDWTAATSYVHCNRSFQWPVTRMMDRKQFVDSFRQFNPSPLQYPGNTWSPVVKFNEEDNRKFEPQDRIDYLYYKSSRLKVAASVTYVGIKNFSTIPNNRWNDWPSDHAALISDFIFI